jgi:hypothetical protein
MSAMWRRLGFALALTVWLSGSAPLAAQDQPAPAPVPDGLPGYPAPPEVVVEIRQSVDQAVSRFHAMDQAGLLAMVSPYYRTGTLTKAGIAEQVRTVFTLHDRVRVRVRIDDVRMVGDTAWVYSTGEVTGRVRVLGHTIVVASWDRELEVGRRENGRWRLYGYQR